MQKMKRERTKGEERERDEEREQEMKGVMKRCRER